jgi:Zn-dependent protease
MGRVAVSHAYVCVCALLIPSILLMPKGVLVVGTGLVGRTIMHRLRLSDLVDRGMTQLLLHNLFGNFGHYYYINEPTRIQPKKYSRQ